MGLIENYRHLIPQRWRRPYKDDPTSVVMLLRTPHFFVKEELQAAAERAWRVKFSTDKKASLNFIAQQVVVTLVKAGPHILNVLHQSRPYWGDGGPPVSADWLPLEEQKQAWLQHSAWASVDYMGRNVDLQLAYCVLTNLVAELLDGNCTGIYIPGERFLAPNDDLLYLDLKKKASLRDHGMT